MTTPPSPPFKLGGLYRYKGSDVRIYLHYKGESDDGRLRSLYHALERTDNKQIIVTIIAYSSNYNNIIPLHRISYGSMVVKVMVVSTGKAGWVALNVNDWEELA